MNWRAEVDDALSGPAIRRPKLFPPSTGSQGTGPWQSTRCATPGCGRISWTGPWCELCRRFHEDAEHLTPDVAALTGPSTTWARKE